MGPFTPQRADRVRQPSTSVSCREEVLLGDKAHGDAGLLHPGVRRAGSSPCSQQTAPQPHLRWGLWGVDGAACRGHVPHAVLALRGEDADGEGRGELLLFLSKRWVNGWKVPAELLSLPLNTGHAHTAPPRCSLAAPSQGDAPPGPFGHQKEALPQPTAPRSHGINLQLLGAPCPAAPHCAHCFTLIFLSPGASGAVTAPLNHTPRADPHNTSSAQRAVNLQTRFVPQTERLDVSEAHPSASPALRAH